MMKIKMIGKSTAIAALLLSAASVGQAATVNVFLDNGALVPGSSNTGTPFAHLDRDATWDVSAAAEPGITNIGAEVMEVRMLGIYNPFSRRMTQGGGWGVGIVDANGNNAYQDEHEAAVFQLTFYEDVEKTLEIEGVNITLKSVTPRTEFGDHATNMYLIAYASSRELMWGDLNTDGELDDGDTLMLAAPTITNHMYVGQDTNLMDLANFEGFVQPLAATQATDYITVDATAEDGTVVFDENDTFWLRRASFNSVTNDPAYMVGAMAFDVKYAEPEDMIVFRPSSGFWYGSYSKVGGGFNDANWTGAPAPIDTQLNGYGFPTAQPMTGDINGDGLQDMVVAQPLGTGVFQWAGAHSTDTNADGNVEMSKVAATANSNFGLTNGNHGNFLIDINGDEIDDIVTVNPGFAWHTLLSTSNGITPTTTGINSNLHQSVQWGIELNTNVENQVTDTPICGDFNGDGMGDIGVWRRTYNTTTSNSSYGVFIKLTAATNGPGTGVLGTGDSVAPGSLGSDAWDAPLIGDVNGDGRDDLVLYDDDGEAGGTNIVNAMYWIVGYAQPDGWIGWGAGQFPTNSNIHSWGWTNDVPMLGDVNGDGKDDLVVLRNENQWFCTYTAANGNLTNKVVNSSANFGLPGDVPLFGQLNMRQKTVFEDPTLVIQYLAGTGVELTWDTMVGLDYSLLNKSDLVTDLIWATNTTVSGTGGDVSYTDTVGEAAFYKVTGD